MSALVQAAEAARDALVADVTAYAEQETPSDDLAALAAGLAWVRSYVEGRLGAPAAERTDSPASRQSTLKGKVWSAPNCSAPPPSSSFTSSSAVAS